MNGVDCLDLNKNDTAAPVTLSRSVDEGRSTLVKEPPAVSQGIVFHDSHETVGGQEKGKYVG